jgi:hypothetical protein
VAGKRRTDPALLVRLASFRYRVGSVDPATLSDEGSFAPFFEGTIDLDGKHPAEARHAWTAVKSNGVDLQLEYMLLGSDEDEGVRTLQDLDVTGLALEPTLEGRKAIATERSVGLREQRREWDRVRLELAIGDLDMDAIEAAREPEPTVPSEGELRDRAKALGLPAPRCAGGRPNGSATTCSTCSTAHETRNEHRPPLAGVPEGRITLAEYGRPVQKRRKRARPCRAGVSLAPPPGPLTRRRSGYAERDE